MQRRCHKRHKHRHVCRPFRICSSSRGSQSIIFYILLVVVLLVLAAAIIKIRYKESSVAISKPIPEAGSIEPTNMIAGIRSHMSAGRYTDAIDLAREYMLNFPKPLNPREAAMQARAYFLCISSYLALGRLEAAGLMIDDYAKLSEKEKGFLSLGDSKSELIFREATPTAYSIPDEQLARFFQQGGEFATYINSDRFTISGIADKGELNAYGANTFFIGWYRFIRRMNDKPCYEPSYMALLLSGTLKAILTDEEARKAAVLSMQAIERECCGASAVNVGGECDDGAKSRFYSAERAALSEVVAGMQVDDKVQSQEYFSNSLAALSLLGDFAKGNAAFLLMEKIALFDAEKGVARADSKCYIPPDTAGEITEAVKSLAEGYTRLHKADCIFKDGMLEEGDCRGEAAKSGRDAFKMIMSARENYKRAQGTGSECTVELMDFYYLQSAAFIAYVDADYEELNALLYGTTGREPLDEQNPGSPSDTDEGTIARAAISAARSEPICQDSATTSRFCEEMIEAVY